MLILRSKNFMFKLSSEAALYLKDLSDSRKTTDFFCKEFDQWELLFASLCPLVSNVLMDMEFIGLVCNLNNE